MRRPIYMDHHATTPVDARVLERMLPYFTEKFGNAASRSHPYGWEAEAAVEAARERVAQLIGAQPQEIVWTSGATEANNLALLGVLETSPAPGHLVTQATEHKAVLDVARIWEKRGGKLTVLPVDRTGRIDPEALAAALTPETRLVSIMAANNEIGTLQPLERIGRICKERGVLFNTDAAQWVGRLPLDVEGLGVDLLSLSGHKLYAPKGIGALYVRRKAPRVVLAPQIHGGGHERGRRSGTLNVPAIVGLGVAAELSLAEMATEGLRLRELCAALERGICDHVAGVTKNGHPTERLPGNLHLSFNGVEAEALMMSLREVAVSSGAACTSATLEPSHVLRAIGLTPDQAHGSIRFGLGRGTTSAEVDEVAAMVREAVDKLRRLARPGAPSDAPTKEIPVC